MSKALEEKLKISKTVYSWVMPETEKMVEKVLANGHQRLLRDRHREAWTGKQDAYHEEFFQTWLDWASPHISNFGDFSYRYPTSGSSEAIRDSLAQHASLANYRPHLGVPTIHIWKGEYEGYKSLASPYGIRVVEHDRYEWEASLDSFCEKEDTRGHKFYISDPSSIDGNFWDPFPQFLDHIHENTEMKVMLDLCYVGCCPSETYPSQKIEGNHKAIDTVFFSLSKSFGVYYHRIGGMFSKTEHPGLWGNKWFKNLTSLRLGTQLMREYSLTELPDKYRDLQKESCDALGASGKLIGMSGYSKKMEAIDPSDVFLLAHIKRGHCYSRHFDRIPGEPRFCLTPSLYEKAKKLGLYA